MEVHIKPAKNGGFLVEHHFVDGDGLPTGAPDHFTHDTVQGLHDHLEEHLGHLGKDEAASASEDARE